ncbi:MAG: sigma 54-interacting transcriptional regulator [Desulfovibrionaceae bacterium]
MPTSTNTTPDDKPCSRFRIFHSLGLKSKLMLTLIPSVIIILMATGYITYKLSSDFMHIALERNVRVRDLAQAHAVERLLDRGRRDLLYAARQNLDEQTMIRFLKDVKISGGTNYCEFAYLSPNSDEHIFLVVKDDQIKRIPGDKLAQISPNPLLYFDRLPLMEDGEVHPSEILAVEYPFPSTSNANYRFEDRIVRLVTPYENPETGQKGFLSLAIPARDLRNVLSLYNSKKSPLWGYPRSDEVRFSFLFDSQGWILFQSDALDQPEMELTTFLARSGYKGTLGRPSLDCAFRPSSSHTDYWDMVAEASEGNSGLLRLNDDGHNSDKVANYYLSWAPVRFTVSPNKPPMIYAGAAYVDRSQMFLTAGYKYFDVMIIITIGSILLVSLLVYGLSRLITAPIFRLTTEVTRMQSSGQLQRLELPDSGFETTQLQNAINDMIDRVRDQMEEIRLKDETIENVNLKEKVSLQRELMMLDGILQGEMPEIVGVGPRMDMFKSDIAKAAQVDVDLLITGETGTGKQLVAEAVHNNSKRSAHPFISLNCGALDENLLLDALFGHVKGAFSEAKNDRKGAFLEANGGTLFLDEIQSASPKVQQSLLRAIAMRKIKPLGQDTEVDVNVRLICATNANLQDMIEDGSFREDLYYRLKVLTIQTPALREHKESIAVLALHYLQQAEQFVDRQNLCLSKGAVRKMTEYDWPGNVRELINSITRAAVMAETDVIQADEIRVEAEGLNYVSPLDRSVSQDLDETPPRPHRATPEERDIVSRDHPVDAEPMEKMPPRNESQSAHLDLNRRQRRALPLIRKSGTISRSDYQEIVGGKLASRTAIYDLQDMVKKGILIKEGRGPATRYVINPKARLFPL